MRILVIGDSVAGGEWGSVRQMGIPWPRKDQGATDAEKEGTAKNKAGKHSPKQFHWRDQGPGRSQGVATYATRHAGTAHYLREAGHEVGHLYHPGCSNHRSIRPLLSDQPYSKFIKSPEAYGQYEPKNFKERFGHNGEFLHLIPEHEIPWPEIPTTDPLWKKANGRSWVMGFDAIVFFWTGPLRSMSDMSDLGIFLSMGDFQKEGVISLGQLRFLYRALENSALKQLSELACDFHVPIYLIGGQEPLSVEAVEKFSESYGGFLHPVCESFTSLCHPELDEHRPEFLDPLFKSWSEMVVTGVSRNRFSKYPTKYVGSRYDLECLTELKKSIDYWDKFKSAMGAQDAHPDRHCHLQLTQKLCSEYFGGQMEKIVSP